MANTGDGTAGNPLRESPAAAGMSGGSDARYGLLCRSKNISPFFHIFEIQKEMKEAWDNVKVLPGQILSEEFSIFTDFIT